MTIAIPLHIWLAGKETDEPCVPTEEVVRRITRAFPDAVVDWQRGKQHRQWRIQHLLSLGCPDVLCAGERSVVEKTVYVGIEFAGWPGNPVFAHISDLEDGFWFEAGVHDLELLKRAGHALSEVLGYRFSLLGGGYTLQTEVIPGKHEPKKYVREKFRPPFQVPMLRGLADWKTSLHRGLVLFLRQYEGRTLIDEMTKAFSSYEEFASAVLDELEAISPVQKCWSLDDETPFGNGVLLDHGDWLTHISPSGVPRGIFT